MIKSILFLSAFLFILVTNYSYTTPSDNLYPEISLSENCGSDSLITGRNYVFGTKQKYQYSGKLLGVDSLYYRIETNDGVIKLKKEDVLIYKEGFAGFEEKTETDVDTSFVQNVEMKDGNEVTGQILFEDSVKIILKTKSGVIMNIPRSEIVDITKSSIEYVNGKYFIKDPNDARLFVAPTARPIRKNTGFISDVELFFPMIGIGIENVVSIAGGISILPFASEQLMYINAKVTPVHLKNVDLAAGLIYMNITSNAEGVSIGYLGGTFGTHEASLTTGLGIAMGENADNSPMFILGGEIRAGNNVKFISENWIFTYTDASAFSLFGVRFFGSKLAADFALLKIWNVDTDGGWPFFPFVSFTYNLSLSQ